MVAVPSLCGRNPFVYGDSYVRGPSAAGYVEFDGGADASRSVALFAAWRGRNGRGLLGRRAGPGADHRHGEKESRHDRRCREAMAQEFP